ncbi:MAG: hypothetical protein FJZ98_07640 [Chloroflexi bacterium]|nr:hypothetical protein [Chloroflexota bacterium]
MKAEQQKSTNRPNQILGQILLPFIVAFLSTSVAGYFLFSGLVSDSFDFRVWSDISVAFIFLPFILFGPVMIMLMIANIFFVAKLQQKVLEVGKKLQPLFHQTAGAAANLTNLLTKSLIAFKSGFSFSKDKE